MCRINVILKIFRKENKNIIIIKYFTYYQKYFKSLWIAGFIYGFIFLKKKKYFKIFLKIFTNIMFQKSVVKFKTLQNLKTIKKNHFIFVRNENFFYLYNSLKKHVGGSYLII